MNTLLKAACLAVYVLALAGLAGQLHAGVARALQQLPVVAVAFVARRFGGRMDEGERPGMPHRQACQQQQQQAFRDERYHRECRV